MMIRRVILLCWLMVGFISGNAFSQDEMGRRASAFDLGIYAGGAWTTDWFEIGDEPGLMAGLVVELPAFGVLPDSAWSIRGDADFLRLFGDNRSLNVISGTAGLTRSFSALYVGAGGGLFYSTCDGCGSTTDLGFRLWGGSGTSFFDGNVRLEAGLDIFGDGQILKVGVVFDPM